MNVGAKLGPFEIVAKVGAGGMGEVYRARDTRLDRTVAIKVLPSHLSNDPQLKQRFEREARAISSLSHPHICTLYDVGEQDGTSFLVMEFLEGQTLAERMRKGPLALEEALQFAIQIADALDKAHRQGIVHRDLKPGNVMLTKAGVKLLDFGLAKSFHPTPSPDLRSPSPHPMGRGQGEGISEQVTVKDELTKEGTILGTLSYMAPEQVEGKDVDARTDIFAFGVVLYEMATGKKAFTGRSQASLMAAILEREPEPISKLQPMTPPALDRVVRTCLAKDPDDRWQTAHDLKLQLKWIAEGGSEAGLPAPVVARRKSRERIAWAVAAVAIVACAALGIVAVLRSKSSAPAGAVRFPLTLPDKFTAHSLAVSPNGRKIALAAQDGSGTTMLWIRPLDKITAQPLTGTEGATYPFWSPDSRFIGFFANGKLKKIDREGGPAVTLCAARVGLGGAWGRDGTIVFVPTPSDRLHRISAAGGAASELTKLGRSHGASVHRWPQFLPGDTHVVYFEHGTVSGIYAASVDSGESKLLLRDRSSAAYAQGHLLFLRQGALMAQAFDPGRLELKGEASLLAEGVQYDSLSLLSSFSVSQEGTLVYQSGSGALGSQLVWLDREGNRLGTLDDPADQRAPVLSRDGKRANVTIADPTSGGLDIWIYDLSRQVPVKTRFTIDAADDLLGVWSPDSSSIAFSSNRKGHFDLYQKPASGVGAEKCLVENDRSKYARSWSTDGESILYVQSDPQTKQDLWVLPMTGVERKPYPLLKTPFNESFGLFSPDGKWIAYQSDETEQPEIYVNSFPKLGPRFRVSTAGAAAFSNLQWPGDGKEIFYLAPDNRLMAAEVTANGDALEVGQVHPLFQIRPGNPIGPFSTVDGQKFLVNAALDQTNSLPVIVVQNWAAELKRK